MDAAPTSDETVQSTRTYAGYRALRTSCCMGVAAASTMCGGGALATGAYAA